MFVLGTRRPPMAGASTSGAVQECQRTSMAAAFKDATSAFKGAAGAAAAFKEAAAAFRGAAGAATAFKGAATKTKKKK